jgi:thiol-disulfide isomerase/thioredoxin
MKARSISLCAALALGLAGSAPADGPPAPNCSLRSLDDSTRRELDEFRGEVVWVDFWASWCGSCVESFAFLDDLDRALRVHGLRVVGINVDETREDAHRFLAEHPVEFAQLADASGACPREFGVEGMPAAYLIDRAGVIRYAQRGFRAGDAAALRERVEQLLAEP